MSDQDTKATQETRDKLNAISPPFPWVGAADEAAAAEVPEAAETPPAATPEPTQPEV